MTDTTYIVSGFMRSGTSMLMKALSVGGLDVVFDPKRDNMNMKWGDSHYKPNEGGFFELSRNEMRSFDFPSWHKGKLLKVLYGGLPHLSVGNYRVVIMKRDPREIRLSLKALFGPDYEYNFRKIFPSYVISFEEKYELTMNESIELGGNRKDIKVTVLNYEKVLEEPIKHLNLLKEEGWPIEPRKSARIVNSKFRRFAYKRLYQDT